MDNLEKDLDPRMVNATTAAETWNYGGRTEATISFGSSSLYLGADVKMEMADGERVREFVMGPNMGNIVTDNVWQQSSISKSGIFAEYHINHRSSYFIVSGRVEVNHANAASVAEEFENANSSSSSTEVNPGFSLGAIHNFTDGLSLSLFAGRVTRSGGLTEKFINYFPVGLDRYEMVGNVALLPEINNQVDLAFEWRSTNTRLKTDVFFSYLQDYISSEVRGDLVPRLPMSPGVRKFINIDRAILAGAELSWKHQLPASLYYTIDLAYTWGQNPDTEAALPEISPLDLRVGVGGTYLDDKLQPEIGWRYVARQNRIDPSFAEKECSGSCR